MVASNCIERGMVSLGDHLYCLRILVYRFRENGVEEPNRVQRHRKMKTEVRRCRFSLRIPEWIGESIATVASALRRYIAQSLDCVFFDNSLHNYQAKRLAAYINTIVS